MKREDRILRLLVKFANGEELDLSTSTIVQDGTVLFHVPTVLVPLDEAGVVVLRGEVRRAIEALVRSYEDALPMILNHVSAMRMPTVAYVGEDGRAYLSPGIGQMKHVPWMMLVMGLIGGHGTRLSQCDLCRSLFVTKTQRSSKYCRQECRQQANNTKAAVAGMWKVWREKRKERQPAESC